MYVLDNTIHYVEGTHNCRLLYEDTEHTDDTVPVHSDGIDYSILLVPFLGTVYQINAVLVRLFRNARHPRRTKGRRVQPSVLVAQLLWNLRKPSILLIGLLVGIDADAKRTVWN
jgi:hypothetical protein